MITAGSMTAEQLLHDAPHHKRTELVHGRMIVREPAGHRHGRISADLGYVLQLHVRAHDLGVVYAAETGFVLARDPDTVRAADVAFVIRERLPEPEPSGYAELAPDLVIEVLSPDDRPGEVLAKVGELAARGHAPGVGRRPRPPRSSHLPARRNRIGASRTRFTAR